MTQTLPKILTEALITFDEFVNLDTGDKRYELHSGVLVEVAQPIGEHENVTGFLSTKITVEFDRLKLPYFLGSKVLVKPYGKDSGFLPDVLVLDKRNLANEPLYRKQSTVSQSATVPLVIEVVSTNWQDDYALKFDEYSDIGIPEYWIVDYLGLGGKEFIGSPKEPTFTICELVNGQYVRTSLKSGTIQSKAFPELNLTVEQIFNAAAF
ncbi:Uma2 family endonuclease [Rivularia sp. UHCC 0363]|uniref:Uma2 family endonuclease n=1 Tax=Rivularia sp. UHCC 0363 TaxID=3110244 RepID=UPI002B1F2B9D|nr:Uma2 family endonuclease [Rivularia sp. UHCC 0363]MEA5597028.1 Uma2 family endonuclease [Rivularia sp. UHCC 0363]